MLFLRRHLDADHYASRLTRQQQFYGSYFGRSVPVYSDAYSPWFWLWLLDHNADAQACWLYHHRATLDQARYNAAIAQNAALQAKVDALEQQHITRDPAYTPADLSDADLMYSDEYVTRTYSPPAAPATTQPTEAAATPPTKPDSAETPPFDVEAPASSTPMAPPSVAFPPAVSYQNYPTAHEFSGGLQLFQGLFWVAAGAVALRGLFWVVSRLRSDESADDSGFDRRPCFPTPPSSGQPQYNPLHLHIGQRFTLDGGEYAGLVFQVDEILEYTNWIKAQPFRFVAYWAIAQPSRGEAVAIQLRIENAAPGSDGKSDLNAVVLRLHDEMAYSREFHDIVAVDDTGRFQITDDATGEVTAEYYRPEGLRVSFKPSVLALRTAGEGGSAGPTKTLKYQLEYWDYSRRVTDSAGREIEEFLIVEMDGAGWFGIFIGPQIDPKCIRTV